jgi:hypothetical protein
MAIITTAQLIAELSTDTGITDEESLQDFLQKAIIRLNGRLVAAGATTTISVDDNCNVIVSGDYAATLHSLLLLQTECLIAKKRHFDAVSKGIKIKSGSDEVDTTAAFRGYQDVSKSICNELNDALVEFTDLLKKGATENYADMIWYGNQRKYEDVDHDGQHQERRHPFDSGFDDDTASNL